MIIIGTLTLYCQQFTSLKFVFTHKGRGLHAGLRPQAGGLSDLPTVTPAAVEKCGARQGWISGPLGCQPDALTVVPRRSPFTFTLSRKVV